MNHKINDLKILTRKLKPLIIINFKDFKTFIYEIGGLRITGWLSLEISCHVGNPGKRSK
jgi:hypothetical protein